MILSTASPYFKACFASPLQEKHQTVYEIPVGNGEVLQLVVDYCYQKVIAINEVNVEEILSVASYLQMDELVIKCGKFYEGMICALNCLSIWETATKYVLNELEDFAAKFTSDSFKAVVESEDFTLLNSTRLAKLLKRNDLDVDGEEEVFDALVRWTRLNLAERKDSFKTLVGHIRLYHVTKSVSAFKRCVSKL